MLQKMRQRDEKGFTLIELMIVIAIIGILAAIAVPQFMSYRTRSYNASAKAVTHNIKADEANLNAELGIYGHSCATAATLTAPYAGPGVANAPLVPALIQGAGNGITGGRLMGGRSDGKSFAVGVTIGENMIADVTDDTNVNNQSAFIAQSRHLRGDTAYAIDSNVENVLFSVSNGSWVDRTALGATECQAAIGSLTAVDGAVGGGLPYASWKATN